MTTTTDLIAMVNTSEQWYDKGGPLAVTFVRTKTTDGWSPWEKIFDAANSVHYDIVAFFKAQRSK